MFRTRETLGEGLLLARVDNIDGDEPVRELQCCLDRIEEPVPKVGLHRQAVDDDLDRVLELLVELDLLVEETLLAVDLHAREPFATELFEEVFVLALAVADHRRIDRELRPLGKP